MDRTSTSLDGTIADKSYPYPQIWDQLSLNLSFASPLGVTNQKLTPNLNFQTLLQYDRIDGLSVSVTRLFQSLYPSLMWVAFALTCAPWVPCPKGSQIELQNNPICRISFPLPLLSSCTQTKLYGEDSLQDRRITKRGSFLGAKLSMMQLNPVRPSSA